jgi:hypothetical protein
VLGVLSSVTIATVLLIYLRVRTAPEGYEDNQGFHFIQKRARGSEVILTGFPPHVSGDAALKHAQSSGASR